MIPNDSYLHYSNASEPENRNVIMRLEKVILSLGRIHAIARIIKVPLQVSINPYIHNILKIIINSHYSINIREILESYKFTTKPRIWVDLEKFLRIKNIYLHKWNENPKCGYSQDDGDLINSIAPWSHHWRRSWKGKSYLLAFTV